MRIIIINGPNLNLLGKREKSIYGSQTFEDYLKSLRERHPKIEIEYFQSNLEGLLLDKLHEVGFTHDGIILNAGAYSHTSIAIADAIAAITSPVLEVHISNIHAREEFRHHCYLSKNCVGSIVGLGLQGYELGLEFLIDRQSAS